MSGLRLKQYRYMGLDCRKVSGVESGNLEDLADTFLSDCADGSLDLSFVSPMKINLITGINESGDMWGFDVISASRPKIRNKDYLVTYPDSLFRCQDYDLAIEEPTIIRIYRVYNKTNNPYCEEQILACLPSEIVNSICYSTNGSLASLRLGMREAGLYGCLSNDKIH